VKKRFMIPLLAVVPVVVIGTAVVSADAATVPAVSFTRAYYNSPGTDNRSNTSLNAEYVRLTNNTSKAIQLKGWTVRDTSNHVYTFGSFSLAAHKNVYIHTGKGTNGKPHAVDRFWGSGNYIWNNTGDTATLKNTKAKKIDTCSWKNKGSVTSC
jgi:hypothetical protein